MDYKNTVTKLLLVILGIVLLAFLVSWVISKRPAKQQPPKQKQVDSAEIRKTEVPIGQAPAKFPTNVPVESGAKISQNYNASTEGGVFQATRVFETSKTLADNYKIYQDFMKADGWAVKSNVNQPTYKMLFSTKGDSQLQVSMDENSATGIKTVNISYTETTSSN